MTAIHAAVWTGSRMLINSGASLYLYDPAADSWSRVTIPGLTPRANATAVWTGTEMIIWVATIAPAIIFLVTVCATTRQRIRVARLRCQRSCPQVRSYGSLERFGDAHLGRRSRELRDHAYQCGRNLLARFRQLGGHACLRRPFCPYRPCCRLDRSEMIVWGDGP